MTIFIILGILLLLAVALVILVKKEIVTFKPEELLPTEKGKIESYLTACMGKIGEEALFQLGLQGGYIEVPSELAQDGNLHLRLSPMNVVPYWAYGPNTNIPSLLEIKERLDQYMEQHLRDCLLGTEAFQETYNLIEKSDLTANTEILDAKVVFNVHWDLEIRNKAGEVVTEVIDHQTESPVKLKKVYETAQRIVEKEMGDFKLEDLTQDLISLEHPDLPVAGIEISCSKKTWDVAKAKQTLQNLLHLNIRELQVKGTKVIEFPEGLPYYQNHYVWDMGEEFSYPQVSVSFNYDQNYPFVFAVTPLSGTKMKSSLLGGTGQIPFLCVQTWKFTYDVVYPVLVQVRDETTGYNFNLAFTVHLIRNIPNRGAPAFSFPSSTLETITSGDYCRKADIPLTVRTYELVENKENGVYNREPLDQVNLSFTCLRYRCEMSPTEYGSGGQGDVSTIIQNYPYCVGGILRGTKTNYREDWQRVVTSPGKEVELNLAPLFSFPVSKIKVVKHELTSAGDVGPAQELDEKETALIKIISTKKDSLTKEPFQENTWVYSPQVDQKILEQESVVFLAQADFTYNLEIDLLEEENFLGGYKINWTIPWDKLQKAQEIKFHVLSEKDIPEEEQLALVLNLEEKSSSLPPPEIK